MTAVDTLRENPRICPEIPDAQKTRVGIQAAADPFYSVHSEALLGHQEFYFGKPGCLGWLFACFDIFVD
jgi:hypothetical protein